jgi:hypothetical protein
MNHFDYEDVTYNRCSDTKTKETNSNDDSNDAHLDVNDFASVDLSEIETEMVRLGR